MVSNRPMPPTRHRRLLTQLVLTITLIATVGCGSRKARVAAPDSGGWIDEFVRQGCYDCLLDARKAYEKLAVNSAAALTRVFEMDLLLALREKELSIDTTATLAHAESVAPRLAKSPAGRMLEIVKAVPEDAAGRRLLPPTKGAGEELDSMLAAVDSSPFSAEFKSYLKLSLQCGRINADPPPPGPADGIPLLAYRRAICSNPVRVDPLHAVRTAVPRFVEASFFLGRVSMATLCP